ncbi:hypothetical protein PG990_003444 [Apiospora arundinis]
MATARDNAIPKKLWCYMAEHWEVQEKFSKNQKAKFQNAQRRSRLPLNNPAIKALNMVCQVHSGQPVTEFKCHGPCSLYKNRDKFSKNQRRNKLRWCIQCCEWRKQFDIGDIPVAHPNEDLSQTDVGGNLARAQDEKALFDKLAFDFELDENVGDDDLGGADDMDSDSEDADSSVAPAVFNGWSDSDDDEYDDEVLPAKSVARGKSTTADVSQRLGDLSLRTSCSNATTRGPSAQASVTTRVTENTSTRQLSSGVTSAGNGASFKQSISSVTTSRNGQANAPAFAGCTPGFVPPHLQAARSGNGGYASPSGTPSVISSDSRAGITNASVYTSQASSKALPASKSLGGQTSTGVTTDTSNSRNIIRRRPDRNGWARPDMRRNFDKQTQFATSRADYIETHESGSEDEV